MQLPLLLLTCEIYIIVLCVTFNLYLTSNLEHSLTRLYLLLYVLIKIVIPI